MSLIFILVGLIWFFPHGLTIYYQSKGMRLIDTALPANDVSNFTDIPCLHGPVESEYFKNQALQALQYVNKTLRYNPTSTQAYLLSGHIYCLLGESESALKAYQEYTRLKPNNPLGFIELIFTYNRICENSVQTNQNVFKPTDLFLCDNASLISSMRSTGNLSGLKAQDFIMAGNQLIDSGRYSTARKFFELSIIVDPESSESWLAFGNAFEITGEYTNAKQAYQHAIDLHPNQADAYYKLADLLLNKLEEFEAASKVYRAAASMDPIPINAYIGIGTAQDRLGANYAAMAAYQKAIELSSQITPVTKEDRRKIVWPRYKLGEVYIRLGELDKAKKSIQSALDFDTHLEWGDYSYRVMGRISELENKPTEAIKYLSEALKISGYPQFRSQLFYDLAKVYISENEFDQGIDCLQKAKSEDPSNSQIYLDLADLFIQTSHPNQAANEYREYLNQWPNDGFVKKMLEEINNQ